MISIEIKEVRKFMQKLLGADCFDHFLLTEASITTSSTFQIDGKLVRDFYTKEEWVDPKIRPYDYCMWKEMRPLCYTLIKGKRTPVQFKFVFHLPGEQTMQLLNPSTAEPSALDSSVSALVLNVRFDNGRLQLVTGTSRSVFTLDKSADQIWDKAFLIFLEKNGME